MIRKQDNTGNKINNNLTNIYLTGVKGPGEKKNSTELKKEYRPKGQGLRIAFGIIIYDTINNDHKRRSKSTFCHIKALSTHNTMYFEYRYLEWNIMQIGRAPVFILYIHYANTSIQIYRKFHLRKLKIFR